MLSQHDADKIRKLMDEFHSAQADFRTANREADAAANTLKLVRASIRPASRTRFTSWLTNSDPDELRRYRQAKEDQRHHEQLPRQLKLQIVSIDKHIDAKIAECLKRSNEEYQDLEKRRRTATAARRSCDEARAMTAGAGSRVDAALAQTQQLRDRDTRETRKATARIAAETAKERTTLRRHLTELAPQLRAYDSFPNGEIQQLSIKFSGRDADFPSHLTTTRSALDTLGNSLAAASRSIAKREHDIEKKQRALVQKARAQILGT